MRDLNFFNSFIEDKKNKNRIVSVLLIVIIVIFGAAISSIVYLEILISSEKASIERNNKLLSSKSLSNIEENLTAGEEEARALNEFLLQVNCAKEYIDNSSNITTKEILGIFNSLPENVSVKSFICNREVVSLQCETVDRKGVASTIKNLKELGLEDVYVPSIVSVKKDGTTDYSFMISGKIREGENNEYD
ncbi:hypothetical protein [Oceanirhabdus sp. W0125-5]|uniref:hypothetical protein n=1 Tax=Oceanirhabdus sp. W0125-5 TaxID=2999116 RepID=UPI0022F2A705|nr:hypothetical protein [Oceanirhabdus sp. W0125-5]WBW99586.1 hypothetical protein OW730_12805 [Oceanirhabdus sp. W0125-5]